MVLSKCFQLTGHLANAIYLSDKANIFCKTYPTIYISTLFSINSKYISLFSSVSSCICLYCKKHYFLSCTTLTLTWLKVPKLNWKQNITSNLLTFVGKKEMYLPKWLRIKMYAFQYFKYIQSFYYICLHNSCAEYS